MREVLNPLPRNVINGQVVPNSAGVRTESLVFVRGTLGTDPKTGKLVSDEIRGQTRQALENVKVVLEAGGTSLEKVAMVWAQLPRREDWPAFNEVYATYFPVDPPARTTNISGIAAPEGALIELTVIAVV